MGTVEAFRSAALNLLFPPKCPFCGRVLSRPGICGKCEKDLPWTGESDGLRELYPDGHRDAGPGHGAETYLFGESGPVEPDSLLCAAPLRYEGAVREALLRYKFRGASAVAEPLGELIARCAAERFAGQFDTVTWVPVSRRRKRKRGYDQSELLARAACRLWDTKPVRLLDKVRDNPAQSGLEDAAGRWTNVRDVYRARSAAAGRRVLLVDDICTTGATLLSAGTALRRGGAMSVVCVAAARTGETGTI